MGALYTLEDLGCLKKKVAEFRSSVEDGKKVSKKSFVNFCGDINLFLRRRFPQSSKAQITKEEMRRIHNYAKEIKDDFDKIDDYFDAFNNLFLLVVKVERLVTFPKNVGPTQTGI